MFGLFLDDVLKDFWGNSIGDIFIEATCKALKLQKQAVDLLYYQGLDGVPEHFEFDSEKNLIVKQRHVKVIPAVLNEEGQEIEPQQEEEFFTVLQTLSPEVYVARGDIIKPC
jgi:hypothetical protein